MIDVTFSGSSRPRKRIFCPVRLVCGLQRRQLEFPEAGALQTLTGPLQIRKTAVFERSVRLADNQQVGSGILHQVVDEPERRRLGLLGALGCL